MMCPLQAISLSVSGGNVLNVAMSGKQLQTIEFLKSMGVSIVLSRDKENHS